MYYSNVPKSKAKYYEAIIRSLEIAKGIKERTQASQNSKI
jgi:hypothetical protein